MIKQQENYWYVNHGKWFHEVWVRNPVFRRNMQLFWWNTEQFIKIIEQLKRDSESINFDIAKWITMWDWSANLVYIKDMSLSVVNHEILHVTNKRANEVGIVHSKESEEWFTYTQEYILYCLQQTKLWKILDMKK